MRWQQILAWETCAWFPLSLPALHRRVRYHDMIVAQYIFVGSVSKLRNVCVVLDIWFLLHQSKAFWRSVHEINRTIRWNGESLISASSPLTGARSLFHFVSQALGARGSLGLHEKRHITIESLKSLKSKGPRAIRVSIVSDEDVSAALAYLSPSFPQLVSAELPSTHPD